MPTRKVRWWHVVTSYPCPVCDAGPGHDCVTDTGHRKGEPHAARARLASADGWHHPDEEAHSA